MTTRLKYIARRVDRMVDAIEIAKMMLDSDILNHEDCGCTQCEFMRVVEEIEEDE